MQSLDVLILGGGASGFFAGCELLLKNANLNVQIWEKSNKTLSKVRISGGGRCNVTHQVETAKEWIAHYPRGSKYLKSQIKIFGLTQTIEWFDKLGITLITEEDGRMFPSTNSSETVAAGLENCFSSLGGVVKLKTQADKVSVNNDGFIVIGKNGDAVLTKSLVLAMGGMNGQIKSWILDQLPKIEVVEPAPSIFSLNIKSSLRELLGISIENARVRYPGEKGEYSGPLLITHWGLSGPAALKSSAWKAFWLKENGYQADVLIGWISEKNEDVVRAKLKDSLINNYQKKIENTQLFELPKRLWIWMLQEANIPLEKRNDEVSKNEINRLIELLLRTPLRVEGKTTYKDEFVTAGGVSLDGFNATGESKDYPNLYALGELMNIDGVTGGFNFQAAWCTAFNAANSILKTIYRLR